MIAFDCPNCGNHLKVGDEFAGRAGWCRQCKTILIVPDATGLPPRNIENSERSALTERLFRHAVSRTEVFRELAFEAHTALSQLSDLDRRVQELSEGFEEVTRRLDNLSANADVNAAVRESMAEVVEHLRDVQEKASGSYGDCVGKMAEIDRQLAAHAETLGKMEALWAEQAGTLELLKALLEDAEKRSQDHAGRFDRLDSVTRELLNRVESVEARKAAPDLTADIAWLRNELESERSARLRMEQLISDVSSKMAELESSKLPMPYVAPARDGEAQPLIVRPMESDGADTGQEAILGAFLRFMDQSPREQIGDPGN